MIMSDSSRRLGFALIVAALVLISGCGGGNPPAIDPCITDPNLSGCNLGDTSGSVSIDKITSPIITSSILNDLIDITQIAMVTAVDAYAFKSEIQAVDQTAQYPPVNTRNDCVVPSTVGTNCKPSTAPFQYTVDCLNNNTYSVAINDMQPNYNLEGKTVTVTINNIDITNHSNPELTCQFGYMYLSGLLNLTRIVITEDPNVPGSWTLNGELWPTLTVHDGNYRAFISNPIRVVADYTPSTGLSLTGTVMDSSAFVNNPNGTTPNGNNFIDGIGIVASHYPAGTDPNTTPFTTYNILQKDFVITAHLDNIDSPTQLSATADGTMVGDITGTDLFLNIQSDAANPIVWNKLDSYDLVPKRIPANSGTLLIEDTNFGSSSLMTIVDNTGKLTLTVVDNTLAASDPAQTTINDSNWLILTRHLGQPGVM